MHKNLKAYQTIDKESSLIASDPHHVISMLFNGIFDSLNLSKISIKNKQLELKSQQLSKAINILRALQGALDFDAEPVISKTFFDLYAYCIERLVDVSVSLEVPQIDEVINLLEPLGSAWKNIPENEKEEGLALLRAKESA